MVNFDLRATTPVEVAELARLRALEERLRVLQFEVGRYLDKPGCNDNSKRTAMARLGWALEQSK